MKLFWKLFLSYIVVVIAGAGIVVLSTAYTAPIEFAHRMQHMPGVGNQHQRGMAARMEALDAGLTASMQHSLNLALFRSTLVASLAAIVISFFVSQRITRPIRQIADSSQRIAAGHYGESLPRGAEDELGELIQSFNRMAQSLAQTEALRQQLIADVSHELKTPLASITAYMEGLLDGVLLPNEETFAQVQREAHRMQRLVQDIQQLSRAEAGQLPMKMGVCNAAALAASVLEWVRPQFEEKSITLTSTFPEIPLEFTADCDRISQVLLNLLDNALQYTPSGGQVVLYVTSTKTHLQFDVKDTGIGLTPEATELIFQRFYRVDKSRSRESGGSGLGLTIAKHIVEAHGGSIWVECAGENQGSTFFVRLPIT